MTIYTDLILKNKVKSPEEFLYACLDAFGIGNSSVVSGNLVEDYANVINQRYDRAIEYHQMCLDSDVEDLNNIQKYTDEQLFDRFVKIHSKARGGCKNLISKYTKENKIFQEYIDKISTWDCDDELLKLKDFAIRQLKDSQTDVDILKKKYLTMSEMKKKFQKEKDEFRKKLLDDAQWGINFNQKEIDKLKQRKAEQLEYYNKFKEEIKKLKV